MELEASESDLTLICLPVSGGSLSCFCSDLCEKQMDSLHSQDSELKIANTPC